MGFSVSVLYLMVFTEMMAHQKKEVMIDSFFCIFEKGLIELFV